VRTQKMDVEDWRYSAPPAVPKAKARRLFFPPTLIGIFGTLLLHVMFIGGLPFGGPLHKPKPPETQESSNAPANSSDGPERLVLLSLSPSTSATPTTVQPAISSLPDLSKMKIKTPIAADLLESADLETLALSEDQPSSPAAGGQDGAEQARLFGIYTGQIQARIDRVWRRPRTPVNDDKSSTNASESFQCEAQIIQDVRGNVQEIMLPRCNGSPAWQHSLVTAIQHASPLPAPPSEKVFRTSIKVQFVGLSYIAGASRDEYESERPTLIGSK
jgi:TonB C terminal